MSHSRISKVLLVGAITAGLTACGPSKVDQCNSLSSPINKVKPAVEKFAQGGKDFEKEVQTAGEKKDLAKIQSLMKEYSDNTRNLGKELDDLSKEIGGVALKDEKLVGFKDQYVQTLNGFSQEIGTLTTTLETMSKSKLDTPEGLAEFEKAGKALDGSDTKVNTLVKQESDTVNQFNTYCTGK
jgi:outer membrane murein-binding lipoprotein Lpp